jgi:hypothetical protein
MRRSSLRRTFGAELFARTEIQEIHMAETFAGAKRKIIGGATALALAAGTLVVMAQPAAARPWHHHHWHHHGFWPGAVAAGIVSGAIAAATAPVWAPDYYGYDEYPAYGPPPSAVPSGVAYCEAHFRSYNPATGTYLGYDGVYHRCP